MNIFVVGTGHTKFGVLDSDIGELMLDVCNQVLASCNTTIDAVDAIYIANFSSSFSGQCHLPAVLASKLGISNEITRVESACAAGSLAFKQGVISILSGLYKTVLIVGVEKMSNIETSKTVEVLSTAASKSEIKHGMTFPALYALMAQSHFKNYGTTEEHLAKISVKNHQNALLNPLAHFRKNITVEDVLNSRVIASPLKLLDCSPVSDGAAAVLLCEKDLTSKFTNKPIKLEGMAHLTESIEIIDRPDLSTIPSVLGAAKKAFDMANLTPQDIDLAEVHDCFTIAELIQMEDLGFCKKGEGKLLIEQGETQIGKRIPINPSGGLKAKGHPIGATGVSQIIEVTKQLKNESGKRQIKDAKFGLCCNLGGSGSTAIVNILSNQK